MPSTEPLLSPTAADESLAMLGISNAEEALYRALLRAPGSTARMLVDVLRTSVESVEATMALLEGKGFASCAPGTVPRFFPSPPDIAVESLLLRRQKELQEARRAVAGLQREQRGDADGNPVVEIIDADPAAQQQPFAMCHSIVKTEMMCLMRPPFLVSIPDQGQDDRAKDRKPGVLYRNIVHADVLGDPGWCATLRRTLEAGEHVRLLPDFPFKMLVADRELGLMPLKIDEPAGEMLLLRRSAVLDALCELFETMWAKAVPIRFGPGDQPIIDTSVPYPPQLQGMVPLLAAGANDKSIAELLGVSERTLMRRMEALYQGLNAKSRFQAGWLAAMHAVETGTVDPGNVAA
jgi:hypothetical protein